MMQMLSAGRGAAAGIIAICELPGAQEKRVREGGRLDEVLRGVWKR
jgi:hypothetical protein